MSCNCKNTYQKSAQTAYNNADQAYVAAGMTVNILGNLATDTGVSISTQTGGFRICSGGLFCVSFDVTSTPAAAGAQILQLYSDATPLPCAIATDTVATCCAIQPSISARISGVAGTINHVCASAVKLA